MREFLYFAYGSNMLTTRLTARCLSTHVHGRGHVIGRRLSFQKISKDKSGKCDIPLTDNAGDCVEGVLFWIDGLEKSKLDNVEGLGNGYGEETVDVVTTGGTLRAHTYVANATNHALDPYHWYKGVVVAGALEHKLPQEYVVALWGVSSIPDPCIARQDKRDAEALLKTNETVWNWYQRTTGD